jgi:hypothetical protein
MSHMSITRAALLATAALWVIEWISWEHLPTTMLGHWSIVAVRATIFGALAVFGVQRGRRWSAPLVPLMTALLATVAVAVVGVATGQFALRGIGPALTIAFLLTTAGFALVAGMLATAVALLWRWRARSIAQAG